MAQKYVYKETTFFLKEWFQDQAEGPFVTGRFFLAKGRAAATKRLHASLQSKGISSICIETLFFSSGRVEIS